MKAFWEIQEINNLTERRCSRLKQSGSSLELFFPFEHKVSPRNDEQCLSMCLSMCRWKFSIKKKKKEKKKKWQVVLLSHLQTCLESYCATNIPIRGHRVVV